MGVAGAIAASAVVGAGASIYGSTQAANAAKSAANQQQAQYQQTRADLQPYFQPGQDALGNALTLAQGSPTGGGPDYVGQAGNYVTQAGANVPSQMTQAQLEATPGYQFTRDQGLKSIQSANAAKGLGVSGAALKGAATYATGLADKTYQDQFNIAQQRFNDYLGLGTNSLNLNVAQQGNLSNQFNRLNSIATIGENAAAGLGAQGTQAAANQGNYLNQAGLASAAGTSGVANAAAGGVNNYLAYQAYQNRTNALTPTTGGYGNTGISPAQGQAIYDAAI
jgi:hypothetical protein